MTYVVMSDSRGRPKLCGHVHHGIHAYRYAHKCAVSLVKKGAKNVRIARLEVDLRGEPSNSA